MYAGNGRPPLLATGERRNLGVRMTQQELDFTDYFIGSAAQGVINGSDIPVLSITPSPKKDTSSFVPY